MYRSLNIAASGMHAQQTQIDVLAHNIANVNTPGFKKSRVFFEEVGYQDELLGTAAEASPRVAQIGLGVRVRDVAREQTQGALTQTGTGYDVAIDGAGFLPVVGPDGQELYLRAGNLRRDGDGRLVSSQGYELAARIVIPEDAEQVTIAEDGTVRVQRGGDGALEVAGQLEIATFAAADRLAAAGNGLYRATGDAGIASIGVPGENGAGRIVQGSLEGSNVDVVEEIIALIASQRAYELNGRVLQTVDEMMRAQTQLR